MHLLLLGSALVSLGFLLYGMYRLNERLGRLESNRHKVGLQNENAQASAGRSSKEDVFLGLRAELLFRAMAGEDEVNDSFSEDARKRFELIVRKHILAILEAAQQENQDEITHLKTIRTLRGPFESWLPQEFVEQIASLGAILSSGSEDESAKIDLNRVIEDLYLRLQLEPPSSFLVVAEPDGGLGQEEKTDDDDNDEGESEHAGDAPEDKPKT